MILDLPVIWAVLLAAAVFLYAVLDGFDLGIGIVFPAFRDAEDRDVMVNTVAPVWDSDETWLVLGGGGLFAVFPLAYALILPALYASLSSRRGWRWSSAAWRSRSAGAPARAAAAFGTGASPSARCLRRSARARSWAHCCRASRSTSPRGASSARPSNG